MQSADRILAPVFRRLDMMLSRGVLRGTTDDEGIQRMQLGLLEDETADRVERIQTYGLSAVPPEGGDALVAFIQGNRDHGVVLAVNDRASRPKDLKSGEVCLYSEHGVTLLLNEDGDLVIKTARHLTVEVEEDITVKAKKTITIEADEKITLKAPEVEINP